MNRKQRRAKGAANTKAPKAALMATIVHKAAIKSAQDLLEQEKWTEAADVYRGILAREPDNASALFNLGLLLGDHCNELEEAAACFTRLLRRSPEDGELLAAFGFLRSDQGMTEEAMALMERAVRCNPSAKIMTRIGTFHRQAGEMEKAKEYFAAAIKKDPEEVGAYYCLGNIKNFAADDPDFIRLLALAEGKKGFSPEERLWLEFTLARAFQGQKDPDRAFGHYAEGNRLKRGTYPRFEIAKAEEYADSIIRLFDAAFVKKFRGRGVVRSDRPLFVVGMPRSGSTLVDQILSSHPAVGSVGESKALSQSIPHFANTEVPDYFGRNETSITKKLLDEMSPAMLEGIAQKYLSLTDAAGKGRKHVVDKMLFNYLWIGLLRLALPEAKIIHCTRDPVDIGLSIWQLLFTPDIHWAYDLGEIGRYCRAYRKIMAHWNSVFPGEIYAANYEAMVADQEGETRKLLAFCGLPWDDRCMRFHENKRHVHTASSAQVRRPIYGDSVRKWKKYEKYLTPLIEQVNGEETA